MLKAQFVYSYYYSFFSAADIFAAILRTIDYLNGESIERASCGLSTTAPANLNVSHRNVKVNKKSEIPVFLLYLKEMIIDCQIRVLGTFPDDKPSKSSRKA